MALLRLTFDNKPVGELTLRPSIRLESALLCADCSSIFTADGDQHCPACGSAVAMLLAPVLNKQHNEE